MTERRSWNWRDELTPEERRSVAAYDKAMQRAADNHRLAFVRIQNRAVQRARYRASKESKA